MRSTFRLAVLAMLLSAAAPAPAQVSIGIGLPSVSIGINLSAYPALTPVPGYPVYYAPGVASNYFFYDGMYWVYQSDNWYASSWYNGPWGLVAPEAVPVFVLRIPVRYYRQPPAYFRGWQADRAPRWDEHWGHDWSQRRQGWNQWNHAAVPARAPLPGYQGQYRGERYPHAEHGQNYHYQPREEVVRQHYQTQGVQIAPPAARRAQPQPREGRDSRPEQGNGRGPDRDRGDEHKGDERGHK
jgi:hypothetical protein